MNRAKSGSPTTIKAVATVQKKRGMKQLRTVVGYAAMALGVTVGGVVLGGLVIAPAMSRAKPLFERTFSKNSQNTGSQQTEGTGGAVGQADGDPLTSPPVAQVAETQSFKPMIASAEQAKVVTSPRLTGFGAFKYQAAALAANARRVASRVPKIFWVYADIGAVLMMAGVWFWRRRRSAPSEAVNSLPSKNLDVRSPAALPTKLIPGKGGRTPKAVAALAEAGNSPADIARRTGLPLDAVAMLLSMGSFGARQLQPPTA